MRRSFSSESSIFGLMTGCTRVQGTAWVDKASGRLAKFNIDAELKDKSGTPRKEHYEALVTPRP